MLKFYVKVFKTLYFYAPAIRKLVEKAYSVTSHRTHEWVVSWLRIMDSFIVFKSYLFRQTQKYQSFYVVYFLLRGYFLAT